jgi:hypothetical protein
MVKINKTLGLALLTALAASCSSDNDVAQSNNPVIENGEAAYATLRIDLPTQHGSRALSFDSGLESEYKVNDATLLVFKKVGSYEGAYTFSEAVNLGSLTFNPSTEGGVSTEATVKAKLTNYSSSNDYYALVILNNTTESNGNKITLPTSGTYASWNNNAANATNMVDIKKGFVMANAPQWTTAGSTPTTLVHIDGSKVAASEEKATQTAADIHVERGLAKVTMEQPETQYKTADGYNISYVSVTGWALDVTNKSSYPVHNIDNSVVKSPYANMWKETGNGENQVAVSTVNGAGVNRFHDTTTGNPFKRVFWGYDPNYQLGADYITGDNALANCQNLFTMATDANLSEKWGDDYPQYCLENTFDINNMTQGQTTRVLIKGKITINSASTGDTFYRVGGQKTLYTATNFANYIQSAITAATRKDGSKFTIDLAAKDNDITATAGQHKLTAANITAGADVTTLTDDELIAVNNYLNNDIETYLKGECYYVARIQHFGATDETPWQSGYETYGGDDLSFLGRYGVLRNNWYALKVNSISGPGDPVIPPVVPGNPDDESEHYINLGVKILQWAKRVQNLDL